MAVEFSTEQLNRRWVYLRSLEGQIKGGILAAGFGKRLDPFTTSLRPKPLFPLGGKVPIIQQWVDTFVRAGITQVSMNTCVLKEEVRAQFQSGEKDGINIQYAEEEVPTGTFGGAAKQFLGNRAKLVGPGELPLPFAPFQGSTMIIPSGDIITNFGAEDLERMYDLHKRSGAAMSLILTPIPWDRRGDFGTVTLDRPQRLGGRLDSFGQISSFVEKDPNSPSNLNNASIYMLDRGLVEELDKFRTEASRDVAEPFYDFGQHVFPALLGKLRYVTLPRDFTMTGITYTGRWFDIGKKPEYLEVNRSILDGEFDIHLPYAKFPGGYLGHSVSIDFSKVTIRPPVVIGNNCIIEPGATIGPYAVVGDGWRIGRNVDVSYSVMWQRYPFYTKDGRVISIEERKAVDAHEVRDGVGIFHSIVSGGTIDGDLHNQVANPLEDGSVQILSLDYVPTGPRA